jgi:uncharacterized protein (UPF0333 family)
MPKYAILFLAVVLFVSLFFFAYSSKENMDGQMPTRSLAEVQQSIKNLNDLYNTLQNQ